jgi:hypothetical protein
MGQSACDVGCIVVKKGVAVSEHLVARGNATTFTRREAVGPPSAVRPGWNIGM